MLYSLITLHPYTAVYCVAINIFCFVLYGLDKYFAVVQQWRVRERTLLLIALCGGTIGAWCGVVVFRHKKSKASFMILLACITLAQIGLCVTWLQRSPVIDMPVSL